ncbi:MAG: putative DNA ligase, partial [Microgenomates group bacterium Gr01-1014_16]
VGIQSSYIVLFSRGLENVTAMYPDVVEGLAKQIKHDCIVEGEMIALGKDGKFLPFQETAQRKRKYQIAEMAGKIPLTIFLFEVLRTDKTDMTNRTYEERRGKLESLVIQSAYNGHAMGINSVRLMPQKIAESTKDIEEFFEKAIEDGTEGIIAKKLDGIYAAGARNFNWIKYKNSYDKSTLADTIDAVVMGYDAGQGKRAGFGIGDFLIGVYDIKTEKYLTVAKVGTGLTDIEWKEMKVQCSKFNVQEKPVNYEVTKQMECDHWVMPKLVVEIKADEITKSPMHTSGLALRFPRFVGWREKKPEDTTSAEELKRLYTLQGTSPPR